MKKWAIFEFGALIATCVTTGCSDSKSATGQMETTGSVTTGSAGTTSSGTTSTTGTAGTTGTATTTGTAATTGTAGATGDAGTAGDAGATGDAGTTADASIDGSAGWVITSPVLASGAAFPADTTCNGGAFATGKSPELDWTDGPAGTKSYAIVLKDMSVIQNNDPATNATVYNRGFHWVIWDIPASARKLPAMLGSAEFPTEVAGARQWAIRNQFGYFGPCPNSDPTADAAARVTDNYSFTLYALPSRILAYPAMATGVNNYTRTITDYLEQVAIGKTELRGTSNAASSEAPPALDPTTIKFPSARWSITSPALAEGAAFPAPATCSGGAFATGKSPELDWTAGPATAKSYAIVLKDLSIIQNNDPVTNATVYNRGFHWVIWDIPTTVNQLPAMLGAAEFPTEVAGARQWAIRNQFGYFGPCPNSDPTADAAAHVNDTYSFTLYALDVPILAYPAMATGVNNYTRTITDYLEQVNVGKTELQATSNAASSEAPPALDPTTIKFPSARP